MRQRSAGFSTALAASPPPPLFRTTTPRFRGGARRVGCGAAASGRPKGGEGAAFAGQVGRRPARVGGKRPHEGGVEVVLARPSGPLPGAAAIFEMIDAEPLGQ